MGVPRIYAASSIDEPLRQSEILSDVVQVILDHAQLGEYPAEGSDISVRRIVHPLAIVVSQDCDLDREHKDRAAGKPVQQLPNILLCEVNLATEIHDRQELRPTKFWERVKNNKDERYQFLERLPSDCDAQQTGLPEMALDFKRCFSIPTLELYLQLKSQAKRRCRLVSPYVEHLSQRLFHFHARIGLPADHQSEPETK